MEGIIKRVHDAEQILVAFNAVAVSPAERDDALTRVEEILDTAICMCHAVRMERRPQLEQSSEAD